MKKLTSLLLAAILLLSLCACAETGSSDKESGKLKIVATIFPQYDFARQIAGDLAEVTMLLSPGEETHTFDPSPADIINIQNCDIFIYGGGESDSWIDDILSSVDTSGIKLIAMMEVCDLLEESETGHEHDHEDSSEETVYDEHVWTSPANSMKIVSAIAEALCSADPDNSTAYREHEQDYLARLEALDSEFKETVAAAKRNTIVFGDRFPLLYFAEEYGLEYSAAFPGCASNTEPSAATVAALINLVKAEDIPIVFKIELSNGQTAQTIAEASGARVETFYSCHTVSKDDFGRGETYISLMEKNISLLKEALN